MWSIAELSSRNWEQSAWLWVFYHYLQAVTLLPLFLSGKKLKIQTTASTVFSTHTKPRGIMPRTGLCKVAYFWCQRLQGASSASLFTTFFLISTLIFLGECFQPWGWKLQAWIPTSSITLPWTLSLWITRDTGKLFRGRGRNPVPALLSMTA